MIKINNLCMDFKSELTHENQKVLKDISFDVLAGDCLGILGESGSGKSTLGKIIVGLLKPTKGEYLFENVEPYKSRQGKKLLSQHISIVFQDYRTSVNPRFTVEEIIWESLKLRNHKKGEKINLKAEIIELLNLVGLDEGYLKRFPHQLSGGQLQRVCIARAIALEPNVILFDEAIGSLDAHTQVQIMDLLKSLQKKLGITYIFITHDLTSVTYLCNKVMFLHHGVITEYIDVVNLSMSRDAYAIKLLNTVITL